MNKDRVRTFADKIYGDMAGAMGIGMAGQAGLLAELAAGGVTLGALREALELGVRLRELAWREEVGPRR